MLYLKFKGKVRAKNAIFKINAIIEDTRMEIIGGQ